MEKTKASTNQSRYFHPKKNKTSLLLLFILTSTEKSWRKEEIKVIRNEAKRLSLPNEFVDRLIEENENFRRKKQKEKLKELEEIEDVDESENIQAYFCTHVNLERGRAFAKAEYKGYRAFSGAGSLPI
jgi:hypothetical protein